MKAESFADLHLQFLFCLSVCLLFFSFRARLWLGLGLGFSFRFSLTWLVLNEESYRFLYDSVCHCTGRKNQKSWGYFTGC